jgi:hypothetical protein
MLCAAPVRVYRKFYNRDRVEEIQESIKEMRR